MDFDRPHRRRNPLTGDWVLVSPHRARRPWQGSVEATPARTTLAYDPACYLCPGNTRAAGPTNPSYEGTFVFPNDFPALLASEPEVRGGPPWLEARAESGLCRVLCYSPRHDLSLGDLPAAGARAVVETWIEQVAELHARPDLAYAEVFENRGEMMGCSNPHPHGQIWATRELPNEIAREDARQTDYRRAHGRCLLCEVLEHERREGERVVLENEEWTVVVPFWALWPFEALLLPRRHAETLPVLDASQRGALAEVWQRLLRRYDRLFQVAMPLSAGWHLAPARGADASAWHAHAHFYPPLLRSATVRKFMVGYELLAGAQRDLTPEQAAARLREAGEG